MPDLGDEPVAGGLLGTDGDSGEVHLHGPGGGTVRQLRLTGKSLSQLYCTSAPGLARLDMG